MKRQFYILLSIFQNKTKLLIRNLFIGLIRISELFALKFENFCIRFFEEQNADIEIESFPYKNDSLLKERTFTWVMNQESINETENTNNSIFRFLERKLKKISKNIVLFFELDEIYFQEINNLTISETNIIFVKHLNNNFKLHNPTTCNYNLYTIEKIFNFIKKINLIITQNAIIKLAKSIIEIINYPDSKLKNSKNYSMHFI